MRNLTKSIATLSLLTPITAYSLGIGEITMHSALNQKLNAEIGLTLEPGENIGDIQVSLASHTQFEKLGISWSYFISKLEFKPLVKSDGKVVIAVTSNLILDDPIMDFLVQVSWPNGDLYKEFTVFVDPPVVHLEQVTQKPSVVVTPPPKVIRRSATVSVQKNDFSSLAVEGEYGPTTRNDSLWKVAEKVNTHNSTSIEQMMMALYKANPKAFYKKNVNALMEGKTLIIPKKAEIFQLSKKEAHRQFYRQMAIWNGSAVPEIEIEIVAESDVEAVDVPEIDVAVTDTSKLTLESPSEASINQSEALTPNLTDDTQGLVTENQQLQERLANLEKQFVIMQEMMAIKDQQLAAMQNVQHKPNLQTGNIGDYQAPTKPQPGIEKDAQTETIVVAPEQIVKPANKPEPAQQAKTQEESGSWLSYYYIAAGALIALCFAWLFGRKRQTEEEINENSMFSTASEQALSGTHEHKAFPVLDKKTSYDVGSVGESSFLSEFTPGDFDVFETDPAEVDPSSEADVYLAYGRYKQAEELMQHAISEQPEKDDYKLKLLEIFYASENKTSFEDYANELASAGKQTDINFWSKVTEMGGELIPDSELFSSNQAEAKFEVTDVPSDDYLNAEIDIPTDVQDEKVTEAMSNYTGENDASEPNIPESQPNSDKTDSALLEDEIESVDFDLSKFDVDEPAVDSQDIPVVNDEQSIDFSPSDIDISLIETERSHAENMDKNNDFDFEFDFDEVPTKPEVELVADAEASDDKESGVSDLTDMDEVETKIDLAKAYIDMGDIPAAKTIVQEVLTEGTDTQKKEAKEILESLS